MFRGISLLTSEHSLGCRGKLALVDLQALTAQVRKLRVRSFIFLSVALRAKITDLSFRMRRVLESGLCARLREGIATRCWTREA